MTAVIRDQLYCPKCEDTLECCESDGATCRRHPAGYPVCSKCESEPQIAGGMPSFKSRHSEADLVPQPYPCILASWQLAHQANE